MNTLVFALAAWICFGMELALPPVLDASASGVRPSFIVPLLVFVALHAETRKTLWVAVVLGVVADLLAPVALHGGGSAVIIGPHAIGFLLAAQLTIAMRGVVIRRNPLTLVVLSVLAMFASAVGIAAVMGCRTFFDSSVVWRGARELIPGFWSSLYTALSALLMSFPLFAAAGVFGFVHPQAQRFARRL